LGHDWGKRQLAGQPGKKQAASEDLRYLTRWDDATTTMTL